MAADKTLVDAYGRYYGAKGMAEAYNNPMQQMQQTLMLMGQEWMKQKEKDKEESMAFVKKTAEITDRIPGVSLLNPQAHSAMTQRINEIVQQAAQFMEAGDAQGYGQAMQQVRNIANQMKDFESAYNLHSEGLTEESYSNSADTAPLNTIFKENGGYEMYFDEQGGIKFKAPADHTGGTHYDYGIDDLKGGMHLKKTEIGDNYEGDMLKQLKYQKATQEYDYDDGFWNKKINSYVNKKDNLLSVFHDDIFGLTREDGSPMTLKEMWMEDPENQGRSANWMNPSNPGEMAADEKYWEGGYNEKAMRAYAVRKLKEHTMKEWDDKKKSIIPESNTNIIFGGSNMKKETFDTSIKPDIDALMMDVDETGFQPDMEDQSWNGIKWKRENGKYFAVDPGQGKYVPITRDQLASSFKINSRKYGYGSVDGLVDTSDDNNNNNNNTEGSKKGIDRVIKGVPYPPRTITAKPSGADQDNLNELTKLYGKFGFDFSRTTAGDLIITAKGADGVIKKHANNKPIRIRVEMNRYGDERNNQSRKAIQDFIVKYGENLL